jgi:hypothetical protein
MGHVKGKKKPLGILSGPTLEVAPAKGFSGDAAAGASAFFF